MAKKGGAQQLQIDVQTDEEFEKFLERPGLLVMDVYSEWCGPCLGMMGSLKKIKLEVGGDNLHLGLCKSDHITALQRFRRKSEPTFLFATQGKAINLMFGTEVPRLVKLVLNELSRLKDGLQNRPVYEISDYQPEEVARRKVKEDAEAEKLRKETEERERKRLEYLTYVTDTIMEGMTDIGVILFGPQVNRDMFKKINEPADSFKIQCKDRKMVEVTKEDFETINFKCPNPLSDEVLEQLYGRELMVTFWRVPEEGDDIAVRLNQYGNELLKPIVKPPDIDHEEEQVFPPILEPLDLKVEYEVEDDVICPEELDEQIEAKDLDEDSEVEDEGEGEMNGEPVEMPGLDFDLGLDGDNVDAEEETPEEAVPEIPKKRTCTKTVEIPPFWIPKNHRTHAALIYVYFRSQTATFLPPDPEPEPPHLIIAFDTYKKKDLLTHAESHKKDVPLFGFFTSDNPNEAKYIANSLEKYKPVSPNDKLVLKVNKATSNTMLSLITYGPSYVSPNTVIGKEEALKFFPETYKTAEQEAEEAAAEAAAAGNEEAEAVEEEASKKGKSKKPKATTDTEGAVAPAIDSGENTPDTPQDEAETEANKEESPAQTETAEAAEAEEKPEATE